MCEKCLPGLTNSNCPTCRTEMGSGVNLVAREVLKNILLPCIHPTCKAILKQDELQLHQLSCEERPVACPGVGCKQKRPLSQLMEHVEEECEYCEEGAENSKTSSVTIDREDYEGNGDLNISTFIMRFNGRVFFPRLFRRGGFYTIEVVILGTKAECSLFSISVSFLKNGVPVFSGNFPLRPIEGEKPKLCPSFSKESMEEVFEFNPGTDDYKMTFKIRIKSLATGCKSLDSRL